MLEDITLELKVIDSALHYDGALWTRIVYTGFLPSVGDEIELFRTRDDPPEPDLWPVGRRYWRAATEAPMESRMEVVVELVEMVVDAGDVAPDYWEKTGRRGFRTDRFVPDLQAALRGAGWELAEGTAGV